MVKLESITKNVVVGTMIDSGTRSCVLGGITLENFSIAIESGDSLEVGKGLRKELESYFNQPVKYLFLTHAHSDHRKGMGAFDDITLIASQQCIENMPKSISFKKWSLETFEDKFILDENGKSVEFYRIGGHSIGSSVAYFPSEKVLFAGDLFFTEPLNFGLPFMGFYQSKPRRTGNPEECLEAFDKFKKMDIVTIVPGHGDVIHNPQEYLDDQISFYNSLKSLFVSAIEDGKNLEKIELPRLKPIERAYEIIETKTKKSHALRFLDNYLNWIKKSFHNYYSGKFDKLE
ncbi:MAG: MBL fold metallo-hydrolase [Candidatus Heimdallarchaeota archaeon]|nr:MBL fold metallo-hydrolase [Candidatus Heimdallarchaeota archaeon]MCK4768818.1 MBL fold metallo-hydrolase [Candidatus Heimdallarchaeota archaeon]